MTFENIETQAKHEQAIYATAVEIRRLFDKAVKEISLPDVDVEERILELVTEE